MWKVELASYVCGHQFYYVPTASVAATFTGSISLCCKFQLTTTSFRDEVWPLFTISIIANYHINKFHKSPFSSASSSANLLKTAFNSWAEKLIMSIDPGSVHECFWNIFKVFNSRILSQDENITTIQIVFFSQKLFIL